MEIIKSSLYLEFIYPSGIQLYMYGYPCLKYHPLNFPKIGIIYFLFLLYMPQLFIYYYVLQISMYFYEQAFSFIKESGKVNRYL